MNYLMKYFRTLIFLFTFLSCQNIEKETPNTPLPDTPYIIVLGIAQDAGYPQANCQKDCCKSIWLQPKKYEYVSCLGLVDPTTNQTWLFDATPDIKDQLNLLQHTPENIYPLNGIFLTHAHMGHYTGLMHLGREAMGAKNIPVYSMPHMKNYLTNNGPWSQLVSLKNIELNALKTDSIVQVNQNIAITPILVPHRDEFSETVGFKIKGPQKSALFIPDIDKWHLWERDIINEIKQVDYAFLDGTFYQNGEIPGRDMSLIPHPFIEESIALFKDLPIKEKQKIHFIHFNHTNPVLQKDSPARHNIQENKLNIAFTRQIIPL